MIVVSSLPEPVVTMVFVVDFSLGDGVATEASVPDAYLAVALMTLIGIAFPLGAFILSRFFLFQCWQVYC